MISVDFNPELLMSPLMILLDTLLLADFSNSLSIYNFFLRFSIFFLLFNGANCSHDFTIFATMFRANLS